MKLPNPSKVFPKNFRRLLSLLLCCVLVASCFTLPASSSDLESTPGPAVSQPENPDDEPVDSESEDPDLSKPEEPGAPSQPDDPDAPQPEEPSEPGEEDPDQPEETECTVCFQLDQENVVEFSVEKGHTLTQEELPAEESTQFGALRILGWKTLEGQEIDPTAAPITEDTVFVAVWGRRVEDLFDTKNHKAYVNGYSNGMFKPAGKVTRAEAVKLFCNLLKEMPETTVSFPDVEEKAWYYESVSAIASLGLVGGYKDGSFAPKREITRAEFIKLAASCDVLVEAENPFPDVKDGSWAEPYITTAYEKDWITGDKDGNFRPNETISRAEAVTVLNRMLGREADANIKNLKKITNFYDLLPSHWAYGHIAEASTDHTYYVDDEEEYWIDYKEDNTVVSPHWVKEDGKSYYVDASGKFVRGEQKIGGKAYLFGSDGAAVTGFFKKGQWTRYYKEGLIVDDIADLGVTKGPYFIKVYKPANYVIVFAKDEKGEYTIPVRAMLASCGEPTPTGTYYSPGKYRWLEMVGGSWAQWCTQILGSYLFHSVPNDQRNNWTMWSGEYNNLGTTRSLGCIRLTCKDAKWVYDNCALGTKIYISPTETSGPLPKPVGIKLPGWHTWDPTDPTAQYLCRQNGCH